MAHKTDTFQPWEKEFLKICRHRSFGTVLDDFTAAILCVWAAGEQEERYLEIIDRYPKDEIRNEWKRLFELLCGQYVECREKGYPGWVDPWGQLYEEYSSMGGKKMSGQFFTPPHICDLLARLTIGAGSTTPTETVRVAEPACGSGRAILALARISEELNRHVFAECVDIDRVVAQTCALNLFGHGIRGIVFHGDTLALKAWGAWHIRPEVNRIDWLEREKAQELLERHVRAIEAGPKEQQPTATLPETFIGTAPQLTLF